MGLIAALRFNPRMGAIVSDEGSWNLRFRRKMHLDNLHKLLDDDIAEELGVEIVYAGSGYPGLHHEVLLKTRNRLRELWDRRGEENMENPPFRTVEDISRIALETLHAVLRRRIDLRLKFYYGFDTDDLIQGSYLSRGEQIEITQESILKAARKLAMGEESGRLNKALFKSRATTFGYDPERGITGYFLDPQKFVMCYNYEGWEAFGAGRYASGMILAQYLNRKVLQTRREGYPPPEGMLTLLDAAVTAMDTFQETGGNLNIVLIDADGKNTSRRYNEIFDSRSHLAMEIVRSWKYGFLNKKIAENLIEKLIFKQGKPSAVETEWMKAVSDPFSLELALRGYKLDEIPQIPTKQTNPTQKKAGR